MPKRRDFVKLAGSVSVATTLGLAGCTSGGNSGNGGETTTSSGGGGGGTTTSGTTTSGYPESGHTIEYIVPFSEGGGTDTYARQIMGQASETLGVNVQINDVPGGASLRGTGKIMNAKNDGYHMGGFNPPSTPLSYLVYQPDYDLTKIKGVCTYATTPYVVIANADKNVKDFSDLVSRYKSGEFKAFGGCQAKGGLNYVASLVMRKQFGMNWENYVGYDGCAPAGQAVASGEIPATIASDLAIEGVVNSGHANVVGVLLSDGSSVFPDAKPITDQGFDNIDYIGGLNRAMWMPPGTDDSKIEVVSQAVKKAINSDKLQQWSKSSGNGLKYGGPDKANSLLQNSLKEIPNKVDIQKIRDMSKN